MTGFEETDQMKEDNYCHFIRSYWERYGQCALEHSYWLRMALFSNMLTIMPYY